MNKHGQPSSRSTSNNQTRNPATDNGDSVQDRRLVAAQAHTRAPVLTRELSVFESLSRNLRTFLPISIPGSPPSPRRRPLSFGGGIGTRTNVPAFTPSADLQRAPGPDYQEGEQIIWAAWDELEYRRVLVLVYTSGVQMWDASNLGAVCELLNLKTESLHNAGPALCAAIMPTPDEGADEFESSRPLLGVLSSTHLTVCSLSTHSIVKQISFTGASSIVARPAFIFISTTHPHMLHIYSSCTLLLLHTINLATPPVFALSLRLLAYASPNPTSHGHGPHSPTFVSHSRDTLSGEVWSGVKAAVTTSAAGLGGSDEHLWGFSRSAPAASNVRDRWMHLHADEQPRDDTHRSEHASSGWVTVVDLMPLLSSSPQSPGPRRPSGIAHLTFSGVGAMPLLCVAPRDGQRVAVFQIRPGAKGRDSMEPGMEENAAAGMPWHWYDLRRGVTKARVDNVAWEKAGRWVGIATGRRTLHVFPTNPYGGKPDERSHLEAQVYNALEFPSLSVEIVPLVRLRPSSTGAPPDSLPDSAPLTFTFLPLAASLALPPSLLPSVSSCRATSSPTARSPHSSPLSLSPVPGSGPRSRRASFQDILLFDPASGVLALRRINLELATPPSDASGYMVSVPGTTGYNMTLPVPIGIGRGRPDVGERQGELVGKESAVATWALKRGREWAEVRSTLPHVPRIKSTGTVPGEQVKASVGNYLAHAELSTHSRSPAVLPRPIYLSHQFSFHALSEDYHALLRRSQFDVPCTKIEVRKDVEVSAYPGDESDPFVHDAVDLQLDARDRRAARGSFDEPIASAIRSGLDYSGQSPPHVAAGVNEGLGRIRREIGKVRSPTLRPTRPEGRHVPLEFDEDDEVAFLGDADAEADHEGGASRDDGDGSGSGASVSVSTPSLRSRAGLGAGGEDDSMWDAWDDEARAAVAEVETFDEISATGFMDEEHVHAPIMAAMSRQQGKGKTARPYGT
ncbi:hypothetical protein JB92DRAFT_2928813 [Gautieria morchelliformis]|nr:hypothetical protein JB92DRAFT_2928813 [Gautieria morchelliformis]